MVVTNQYKRHYDLLNIARKRLAIPYLETVNISFQPDIVLPHGQSHSLF